MFTRGQNILCMKNRCILFKVQLNIQVPGWSRAAHIIVEGRKSLPTETELIPLCLHEIDKMQDLRVYNGKWKSFKKSSFKEFNLSTSTRTKSTVMSSKR